MRPQALFFVGGVRSGKSGLAQRWVEGRARRRLYLATCRAEDAEMAARVARHQAQRGPGWRCLEACLDPVGALRAQFPQGPAGRAGSGGPDGERPQAALLDCVSLWLANLMAQDLDETAILAKVDALAAVVAAPPCPLAVVSAEVGLGLTPLSSVGRRFCDLLGLANQRLAAACGTVLLVHCGLPLALKGRVPEELCAPAPLP
ncbi:bifunctional adenosylcobinamide kinase/adenosylcobinamide-phosphate guanylyltransferase [Desulfovibrio legallii]|uniref:Adenosylcobinamide kinase n=1 Tax=Desulfovibrio legallii TaxID=571438 RepID=A0A1G7I1E3_9BACT|nr:bifunctional adenosylcobinamide kinase/adenosylcobinamide-phosphate guanylyltransferase [Desulfovibrio legallii]SDF06607.1 adenosylcobinamide kinase /adenosylcobinamide-phosphate guanylyltransferase [Desulfovibrio legallii]